MGLMRNVHHVILGKDTPSKFEQEHTERTEFFSVSGSTGLAKSPRPPVRGFFIGVNLRAIRGFGCGWPLREIRNSIRLVAGGRVELLAPFRGNFIVFHSADSSVIAERRVESSFRQDGGCRSHLIVRTWRGFSKRMWI